MVSGSQGGDAEQTVGDPKVILHPLKALRLRIAIAINARHGEPSRPAGYRRASWMLSAIVCSEARQKRRATKGGTSAMQVTTIQFGTDMIPIAIATTDTAITQATKSSVLVFSENMRGV